VRATLSLVAIDLDLARAVPDDLRLLMSRFQNGKRDSNQFYD
jgi:hypothetical protein